MNAKRRDKKWNEFLRAEIALGQEALYWLSFSDPGREEGKQFLGVCVIRAYGFISAVEKSRTLGCNPGGEVHGQQFEDEETLPEEFMNRLIGDDGLDELRANISMKEES
jgi:hypothetical protein